MFQHFVDQEHIYNILAEMGGLTEFELSTAMDVFTRKNLDLLQKIDAADQKLDQLDRDLNDFCLDYVSKHSPIADDLRGVFATMKISLHLERIGDYAKNIGIRSSVLDQQKMPAQQAAITRLGQMLCKSLARLLQAIMHKDTDSALQIWRGDAEIDAFYNAIFQDIVQISSQRPMDVIDGTHLLFIARNLERIGDHISNIAEIFHFWMTGQRLAETRPYYEETSRFAVYWQDPLDLPANININAGTTANKRIS